jgi:hypothetical protein
VGSRQPWCALLVAHMRIDGPIDGIEDGDWHVNPIKRMIRAIKQRRAALSTKCTDCCRRRHVLRDRGAARDDPKSVRGNRRPRHERCGMHPATSLAMAIGGKERWRRKLETHRAACTPAVERRDHDGSVRCAGAIGNRPTFDPGTADVLAFPAVRTTTLRQSLYRSRRFIE